MTNNNNNNSICDQSEDTENFFTTAPVDSALWRLNSELRQLSTTDVIATEQMFNKIVEECDPDSYSLATMAKCLLVNRCFDKLFQLQQRALSCQDWPVDEYFYASLIEAHLFCSKPELAWTTVSKMTENGIIPTCLTLSLFIDRLYRTSRSSEVLNRCTQLLKPFISVDAAKEFLRALVLFSDEKYSEALSKLIVSVDVGALPVVNCTFCSRIVRAMSAQGIETSIEALEALVSRGLQIDQSAAIALSLRFLRCTRDGEGERPQLIRGAEPAVQLRLFDALCACGFNPNVYLCNSIINAQVSARNYDAAIRLFDEMVEGKYSVAPDIRTYNILIKMHKQRGDEDAVVKIVAAMGVAGVDPDLVSYNELLSFYGLKGDIDRIRQIWQFIRLAGVQPDQITYSTTITAFGKAGLVQEAEDFFQEMKTIGIRPNLVSYTTMLQMYRVYCDVASAQRTFDEMLAAGIQPDEVVCRTYRNILLKSGLQHQADQVNSIIRRLPSHNRPTARTIRGSVSIQQARSIHVNN